MPDKIFRISDGNGGTVSYTLEGIKNLPDGEFRQYQFYRDLELRKSNTEVKTVINSLNEKMCRINTAVELAITQHNACPLLREEETLVNVAKETRFKKSLRKKIRNRIVFWSVVFGVLLNVALLFLHSREIIHLF